MTDPIPANTTYVPGSLQVTAGAKHRRQDRCHRRRPGQLQREHREHQPRGGRHLGAGGILAANGGTSTVRFRVVIDNNADEGVPIVNTAPAASSADEPAELRQPVIGGGHAGAARRHGGRAGAVGEPHERRAGSITLTATNIGGSTTHGQPVTVTATVPAGVTFGGLTSSTGWTCTTTLPTITCTRSDTLAAGASYPDIVYAITPTQAATNATFGAQVAGGNEVNTSNDTDSDAITFQRSADLRLTKSVSAASASVGGALTYTLTATNLGRRTPPGSSSPIRCPPASTSRAQTPPRASAPPAARPSPAPSARW